MYYDKRKKNKTYSLYKKERKQEVIIAVVVVIEFVFEN
jgi:hypothetical protein